VTVSGTLGLAVEVAEYNVDLPLPLSDTHTGLDELWDMPHGLTRSLSTVGAPLESVTRNVTLTALPAACAGATTAREVTAAVATAKLRTERLVGICDSSYSPAGTPDNDASVIGNTKAGRGRFT
jgi:hypothetical protein